MAMDQERKGDTTNVVVEYGASGARVTVLIGKDTSCVEIDQDKLYDIAVCAGDCDQSPAQALATYITGDPEAEVKVVVKTSN
jgi:hypothetical protein